MLNEPERPGWFLPISGRLYFRKSQLLVRPGTGGQKEEFRTKCVLAVELIREQAETTKGRHLAVFDGGFALGNVTRPLVIPEEGRPWIEFLTRLRHDARIYALPPEHRREEQRGPTPKWGKKLSPPRLGGRWARGWHEGEAYIYGRCRKVRWKEVVCLWKVVGPTARVKAVVAEVAGYKKRFSLMSSALESTGLEMVELFAARFRQEDGFRDLKQRLGWEECRAWTKESDRADEPGAVGDDEPVAFGSIRPGGGRRGGLVIPSAVAPEEGPSQRTGYRTLVQASPGGNSAFPLGLVGR